MAETPISTLAEVEHDHVTPLQERLARVREKSRKACSEGRGPYRPGWSEGRPPSSPHGPTRSKVLPSFPEGRDWWNR